jgi:hypothetical protein
LGFIPSIILSQYQCHYQCKPLPMCLCRDPNCVIPLIMQTELI